ncbi:peptidoglycan-binding domain-containing protein [Streptomyces tanashiensis]|uniref:peptidoglycan-binding domain-containing protein n=1 Tax=Streptomyces tanashiensis TaxID=67367 RepID=UPI0034341688
MRRPSGTRRSSASPAASPTRRSQGAPCERNLFAGPIDGRFGRALQEALSRYQASRRVSESGVYGPPPAAACSGRPVARTGTARKAGRAATDPSST